MGTAHQIRLRVGSVHLTTRRYAVLHRAEYETACRQARDYYQQCIEILQQANHAHLTAKFINSLGEVLQQLGEWDQLETIAKTAADLHQIYPDSIRLANAYAMLAEVALAKCHLDMPTSRSPHYRLRFIKGSIFLRFLYKIPCCC